MTAAAGRRAPAWPRRTAGAALTAGVVHALPALATPLPALRASLGVRDHTPNGRQVALTFDDGPHPQGTPAVLEILAREQVPATFFLVGEQVRRSPGLAGEIVAAGHAVALHCDRHRNLLRLAPPQVRADLDRAEDRIRAATGAELSWYRPPYGVFTAAALWQARRRGWRPLLWTHWGRDWEARASAESVHTLVTTGAGPGSVLLLHDADDYGAPGCWRAAVAALPRVIETLRARGLTLAAL
jgi:peptidoglycan/xylan/chitin deacetylase (PgdA/CDA1 family)